MLSHLATRVVPALGRLTVSSELTSAPAPGTVVAANHSSLIDPGVLLAGLARLGLEEPVVLAAAGLWRIPYLRARLVREGHIPVHRGGPQAAEALALATEALARGRVVVIYPEGGLPRRRDSADTAPGPFRSGLARLALATGAPVVPLGQAGSRRIASGRPGKQIAGVLTSALRRPAVHVHLGAPIALSGTVDEATATAHTAVAAAWETARRRAATAGTAGPGTA
ncbi:lysophospholipid acyltransferase family protein [Streptacidiphilus sp. EB129]|uniref:lysophospholipid acyltransferase family protein n=1 Tax=Streptacidiphilus sp. EB129 TaxID=3156262 RepID=UPI0035185651